MAVWLEVNNKVEVQSLTATAASESPGSFYQRLGYPCHVLGCGLFRESCLFASLSS